jgi:hypothetical protein
MKEIIFIGDEFYENSRTMMSPIYLIEDGEYCRTDWGFVNTYLRNGEEVHIRPATKAEKQLFTDILAKEMLTR